MKLHIFAQNFKVIALLLANQNHSNTFVMYMIYNENEELTTERALALL